MELRYFFAVLLKRKYLLLSVAFLAALTTYFVVGKLPRTYKANTIITAGITDYKGVLSVGVANPFTQEFEIATKFSNLIEYMKARPSLNLLTRQLMLHDLKGEASKSFRKIKSDKEIFTTSDINEYIQDVERHLADTTETAQDSDFKNLPKARSLEKNLGYDFETIKEKLDITRVAETDYIKIEFKSENPELSYFVVKTFSDEFLKYYYQNTDKNTNKSVVFYDKLVTEKKAALDSLTGNLNSYSKDHQVVALAEQSQAIVMQIKDIEMARDEENRKLASNRQILKTYESYKGRFTETNKKFFQTDVFNNEEIKTINDQLQVLQGKYVDANMKDDNIKRQIEELQRKRRDLSQKIAVGTRANDNLEEADKDIYLKYVNAEAEAKASEQTIGVYASRIGQLNAKKNDLVKDNAEVSDFLRRIEVAQKEYSYAVEKQNLADMQRQSTETEDPMRVIEKPVFPDKPEKNNRAILCAFAAIVAGTLAMIVVFFVAFFDNTLSGQAQFQKYVGLPLTGMINKLSGKGLINFNTFFGENTKQKEAEFFKEALRKLRHEIEISRAKSFLFVSLKEQEGKSFLIASLAHSLSLKNKKVLIIDTNFKNNTLTGLTTKTYTNNPITGSDSNKLLPNTTQLGFNIQLPKVDIIGNKGGFGSPSELLAGVDFQGKIDDFCEEYDYVFLEAAAINQFSDAYELVDYVEKVVPIFDAQKTIAQTDEDALSFLKNMNGKMFGCILNKVDLKEL